MGDVIVWGWVQQHRVLSVLILALVIVASAGGTAWALVFRTVSSPVGLREALRMYLRAQDPGAMDQAGAHLPAPGVYTYRTSGDEGLNLVGVERSFPTSTSMIVADGRCATVSWVPVEQHSEAVVECPGAGGGLTLPSLVTDESIAGSTTRSVVTCPATGYLLPPPAGGPRWRATCSLDHPAERVALEGEVLGAANATVGGQVVAVEHVRITLRYAGTVHGTNPTDYWVVPGSGLIVRERETVVMTQGGVDYHERMDATLASLRPAR